MEKRINEDLICVLKKDDSNQIIKSYLEIINPLSESIGKIEDLCDNPKIGLIHLSEKISSFSELKLLNSQYSYCEDLNRPYQGFTANIQNLVNQIIEKENDIRRKIKEKEEKNYEDDFDAEKERINFKLSVKATLLKWSKASAINKAYRRCHEDKSILTFSHRLCGWSNPVYKLTPNFSVEIKTNFGYGNASYFYTILKYKEIEITPFSEWIEYEFANFSEINRYTKSYELENKFWLDATEFCKEACNLSIHDERTFIQKYIMDECEKMVSGLEDIFHREQFSFKARKTKEEDYTVDKSGHELVEYRGEKISGALDFVSKILEFDQIAQIKSFISRIEDSNRRIKPILIEESEMLKIKLQNFDKEMKELYPVYKALYDKDQNYLKEKSTIQKDFLRVNKITYREMDESVKEQINKSFNEKFPEYIEFRKEYLKKKEEHKKLSEKIKNTKSVLNKILKYNSKIQLYFEKLKTGHNNA